MFAFPSAWSCCQCQLSPALTRQIRNLLDLSLLHPSSYNQRLLNTLNISFTITLWKLILLSTWLHPESSKIQAAGHICEGFSWLDHSSSDLKSGPHFLVAAYGKERSFCFLPACPYSVWQMHLFCLLLSHSFTGVRTYFLSGFQRRLKSSWDVQPQRQNSYWNLDLSVRRQPLLD